MAANPHSILSDDDAVEQAADDFSLVDGYLRATYLTRGFADGLALVNKIGVEAERWDHHPDIDLRYNTVTVWLISHDDGAITPRDIRLTHLVAKCAAELGATSQRDPQVGQS